MATTSFKLSQREWSNTLLQLSSSKDFADVTLVTEDGQSFQTHKAILCTHSELFTKILMAHSDNDPVIFLTGIRSTAIQAAMEFMYSGRCEIKEQDIDELLGVAKDLSLHGIEKANIEETLGGVKGTQENVPTEVSRHLKNNVVGNKEEYVEYDMIKKEKYVGKKLPNLKSPT
jgi:hypothetical protein